MKLVAAISKVNAGASTHTEKTAPSPVKLVIEEYLPKLSALGPGNTKAAPTVLATAIHINIPSLAERTCMA